jgi:23S rRNA maturation mini-RNase III
MTDTKIKEKVLKGCGTKETYGSPICKKGQLCEECQEKLDYYEQVKKEAQAEFIKIIDDWWNKNHHDMFEAMNCGERRAEDIINELKEQLKKEAQAEFIKLLKDEHNSREDIIKQLEK